VTRQTDTSVEETRDVEKEDGMTTIITDPFTRADLIKLQKEDSGLQPLFEAARDEESDYMVADDILYAIHNKASGEENPYKIVVPAALKTKILELGHGKSGHFGGKKTRRHIQAHFYWPGIGRDIQDHCKRCPQCMAFNSHKQDVQPQQPIPVVTQPWKKLAMDIVGPLTTTSARHKYMLTVIDLATRYPVAVPLR